MEPASGAGPRTGHAGLLIPARIDATSEMLSALVRLLGCVATARRIAESGAAAALAPLPLPFRPVSATTGVPATAAVDATTPGDESFVGVAAGAADAVRLSPPHAATTTRLDA